VDGSLASYALSVINLVAAVHQVLNILCVGFTSRIVQVLKHTPRKLVLTNFEGSF